MDKDKEQKIQEQQNKIILKQSDNVIKKIMAFKQKRHVKEPTEPIFKDILGSFTLNYGRMVVGQTGAEIIKKFKNDEF